jgi:serine phosphatase RsbU (regulator of sigma subunit)
LLNIFGHPDSFFIFLPVSVSLAWAQPMRYNIGKFLTSAPVYLVLTMCWTIIYYATLVESQVLLYQNPSIAHIIPIASAISWVILFDPARAFVQQHIERRFNVRDKEAANAIEAFAATLREEIDLDQLRERFLAVIQQTMHPYSLALWIATSHAQQVPFSSPEEIEVADNDALIPYVLYRPAALEVDRLHVDSPVLQDLKLHAADVLLPLASQGELVGLLILGPHLKGERYSHEELALLDSLAPQVAPALRVALMVREQKEQARERERIEQERIREQERIEQERIREQERIEQELQTARSIQRAFLPGEVPSLPGWQFVPYYQPARSVGGDFYDFLPCADGRLGLSIGDVTGKGIPAALLMATVHTMLRAATQEMTAPSGVLARVNELLAAEIPAGMFVTCFMALLDPASGRLRYANAGHEPPFLQHEGSASELWATGMPLGMMPGTHYEEYEIELAPGDGLLFYSDGLVEAHNPRHEMFGFPRLRRLLTEQTNGATLIDVLLSELKAFTGERWEQEDDVTLMTLQRTGELGTMNEQQAPL